MTIDELVFDLETEANVLRAVSHLPPDVACELLLDAVRKIRQSRAVRRPVRQQPVLVLALEEAAGEDEPTAPEEVAAPGPLAAPPAPNSNSCPNRSQTILNVLQAHGPMLRSRLYKLVSRAMGEPMDTRNKNRTNSALWQLRARDKVLEEEQADYDRLLSLPTHAQLSLLEATASRPAGTSSSEASLLLD